MNALGIYFGPGIISIVETKGKKLINSIQVSEETITASGLEEKVPDDIKMVTLFKDELGKGNITAKEANLALSGKELIIRTFEIPSIPREDLAGAVNFEAKKYIPFKVEELILDYQIHYDKTNRKNLVLLVGIKKETFDKYVSIFTQLNFKKISLEYAAFSVLRLLKLSGLRYRGIVGVVGVDLQEFDEVNFMVLENGFPLFSRDIILRGGPQESLGVEETGAGTALDKLKTEMRISLEYYQRKFPAKKIDKMFFISGRHFQADLEIFAKDVGLVTQFINVDKHIGKPVAFSLSLLKGYGSALSKTIAITPRIDLISAKPRQAKEAVAPLGLEVSMFKDLRIEPSVFLLALLICIAAFFFGFYQKLPLQKELSNIKKSQPRIFSVNPAATYDELGEINSEYKKKLNTLDNLVEKQLYLTVPLNVLPQVVPKGIWLTGFSFNKKGEEKAELILQGMVYLSDSDKEFLAVSKFLLNLKENPVFTKYFKEINIDSINREKFEKINLTSFSLSCKTYLEK